MSRLSCAEAEELAPELALGTLPGDQRSDLLAHIDECAACRKLVKELSDTADALLLMAPVVDPPAAFARKVSAGLRPPRRKWGSLVAAAAVALVVGLGIGYVPGHVGSGSVATVSVASFVPQGTESVGGKVWARSDNPGWVFMTVHDRGGGDSYACDLILSGGRRVWLGDFQMHNGQGSWGHAVDVTLDQVRSVQLLDPQGKVVAVATLSA